MSVARTVSVGESLTFELVPTGSSCPPAGRMATSPGVATDSQDRVYVFNRSEHPVIVYDRDGRFLGSWGEGVFTRPHGITIVDDVVYCADDTDHTVRGFTLDGKLLWTLGTLNQPSDTGYSPEGRANLAVDQARRGAVQSADAARGRARRRHVRLRRLRQRADPPLLGGRQADPVVGRAGHRARRIQSAAQRLGRTPTSACSSATAKTIGSRSSAARASCLTIWTDLARPGDLWIDAGGQRLCRRDGLEHGRDAPGRAAVRRGALGADVVRDLTGNLLARWGGDDPCSPASFASPHGICLDSQWQPVRGRSHAHRAQPLEPLAHGVSFAAEVRARVEQGPQPTRSWPTDTRGPRFFARGCRMSACTGPR